MKKTLIALFTVAALSSHAQYIGSGVDAYARAQLSGKVASTNGTAVNLTASGTFSGDGSGLDELTPTLFVPEVLYGEVGTELNIYFDNLLIRGLDTDFSWDCGGITSATQQNERVFFVPTVAGASNDLWIAAYHRNSRTLISSNVVTVLTAGNVPLDYVTVAGSVSNSLGAIPGSAFHGYGQLLECTGDFNRVVIPLTTSTNAASSTVYVTRVTVTTNNGGYLDVNAGVLLASGTVSIATGNLTNVTHDLSATITTSMFTNQPLFVGFVLRDATNGIADAGRNLGVTANAYTNKQSFYYISTSSRWQDYSGDPNYAFVQQISLPVTNSVLVMGDSVFAGTVSGKPMSTRLEELATTDSSIAFSFTGTKSNTASTATSPDEARSGWAWNTFVASTNSPFIKPSGGGFDFQYYCTNNSFVAPEYVVVHLGINTLLAGTETPESVATNDWPAERGYINAVHTSITNYSPTTKLVLCTLIPPAYNQDAAGKNYGTGLNRDRQKSVQIAFAKLLYDEYSGREDEGYYIVPLTPVVDTIYGYQTETVAINAYTTNTITRQSNLVHPANAAASQMASQIFSFLKWDAAR